MSLLTKRSRNKEIALATLVELLVQFVFVFTLLLVATGVIKSEGPKPQPAAPTPEAWRTLLSIFDIRPNLVPLIDQQVNAFRRAIQDLKNELERSLTKAEELGQFLGAEQRRNADIEKELAKYRGKSGGPGLPVCRLPNGEPTPVVFSAVVSRDGMLRISIQDHGNELQKSAPLSSEPLNSALSPAQFLRALEPWRTHGKNRSPPCSYRAQLDMQDGSMPAHLWEAARRAVRGYFYPPEVRA